MKIKDIFTSYWFGLIIVGLGVILSIIGEKSKFFYPLTIFTIVLVIIAIIFVIKILIQKNKRFKK